MVALAEAHLRNQLYQFAELARFELPAPETLVETAFQLRIIGLDGFERCINLHVNVGLFCLRS